MSGTPISELIADAPAVTGGISQEDLLLNIVIERLTEQGQAAHSLLIDPLLLPETDDANR